MVVRELSVSAIEYGLSNKDETAAGYIQLSGE
jgi:hypothetical protein